MNYTFNQLRIFQEVCAQKSVSKAAVKLNMSQPAASIQLKNFTEQFEEPLIEIIGQRIHITEKGKAVHDQVLAILQLAEQLDQSQYLEEGPLRGTLRLSVVSTGKYVIPSYLNSFLEKHDQVELEMDVTNKAGVIESLKNNTVDFALVSVPPEGVACHELALCENKLVLVGDSKKTANSDRPYIFREQGSATRAAMERYLKKRKIQPQKRFELTSNEAVLQCIKAGMGISIMPLIGIKDELKNKQVRIIEAPGLPMRTRWRLIWLKSKKLSVLAQQFLAHLEKNQDRITQEQFGWTEKY